MFLNNDVSYKLFFLSVLLGVFYENVGDLKEKLFNIDYTIWQLPNKECSVNKFVQNKSIFHTVRFCSEKHTMKLCIVDSRAVECRCNQRSCLKKERLLNGKLVSRLQHSFTNCSLIYLLLISKAYIDKIPRFAIRNESFHNCW